jgi:hypothetical protein
MKMKDAHRPGRHPAGRLVWAGLAALALLAGCGRDSVKVYQVPKEKPPAAAAANPHGDPMANPHGGTAARPPVNWTVPADWESQPADGMRAGRLTITGKEGARAEVSVTPLAGMTASKLDLVNMWRSQVRLERAGEADLGSLGEKVPIGSEQGEMFDFVSGQPLAGGKNLRLLAAMLPQGGTTWFFKMVGDDDLVREQKSAFAAFLKSVSFAAPAVAGTPPAPATPTVAGASPPPAPPAADTSGKPAWDVPSSWQEQPPTQMLVAKFAVSGEAGARVEITVSSFPGDTGGLLANVNRWRGQVGLPPVGQEALAKEVSALDVPGGQAQVTDMVGASPRTGQKTRLIGVVVPRGPQTWFYKLMGDETLAGREKPALLKFVQSVRYPAEK